MNDSVHVQVEVVELRNLNIQNVSNYWEGRNILFSLFMHLSKSKKIVINVFSCCQA